MDVRPIGATPPAKRPESAAAVLASLDAVNPEEASTRHSESRPLERLARGVFVGREKELERLRHAFDEAFTGHGGLVMLVGEPGIGKTRTTQELETYARMRGANVLWGRTHESSGAPPYWPWVQVGNQWVTTAGGRPGGLGLSMDTTGELSRLFPVLKQLRNFVEPQKWEDPEAAQFRLFDAYATFLAAMAETAPLVVALDDLHWADKPTLQLLQHVARELSRSRILVVGNYRDTDITRQSALSETLAVLNRESGFERIVLRGLTKDEVASYIRAKANVEPKREVLDRIFEETEGNAFFLSEVVNLMAEEGTLTKDSVSDIAIPDGVKEALGRRLNRLSPETNELLQVATVIGREFSYDTLVALGDRDEDQLLKLIEEAIEARVIEELPQPGRYRFTHAQMQETLLAELSTTRRVRLHGQVGEALERRWGDRADQYASRLAGHFVEAAMLSPRHARKAARYARLAAAEAEDQTAWAEAADWYERVLALVTEADDSLDEDEAALLVALGTSQARLVQYRPAWRNLMRALTYYREREDPIGFAGTVIAVLNILASPAQLHSLVVEALERLGSSDPHMEASLRIRLLGIAGALVPAMSLEEQRSEVERAQAIGKRYGFPDVLARATGLGASLAMRQAEFEKATAGFLMGSQELLDNGEALAAMAPLRMASELPFVLGKVDEAERALPERLKTMQRAHAVMALHNVELRYAGVLLSRGDETGFERLSLTTESEVANSYAVFLQRAARAELHGDIDGALRLLPPPDSAGRLPEWIAHICAARARIRYLSGDIDGARSEYDNWSRALDNVPTFPFSRGRFYPITEMGEALAGLTDDATAAAIYAELDRCRDARWDPLTVRGADAIRGQLALRLGLLDEAEDHFQTGLDWSAKNSLHVEQARNFEGLAAVAERHGETGTAMERLDEAAAIYQQQGAKLYLTRVIAKKVELQGLTATDVQSSIAAVTHAVTVEKPDLRPQAAPDGTVTLMFTDIEGSTALNVALGDDRWMAVLADHNRLMREHIHQHHGFEVKTEGDAFMVAFKSARDAVNCAIAIQKAFEGVRRQAQVQSPESQVPGPLRVRIGLHTGEPIKHGDDFYGTHVVLAARIAAQAVGGQVLVSSLLKDLVAASGQFAFDEGREFELKGLAGTHRVYAVTSER